MMYLYRIYTESKREGMIENLVSAYFDGYTIINGTGFWRGKREQCLIIEIVTDRLGKVHTVAADIASANDQESVMVTRQEVIMNLIEGE